MRRFRWLLLGVVSLLGVLVVGTGMQVGVVPPLQEQAIEVLIVGGDQHHDFDRWFNEADSAILEDIGADVSYTDAPREIVPRLDDIDVLYLSNNQPLPGDDLRSGIFDVVDQGKGLMIYHAAAWYSWEDWPEFNRELVGGGARSHRDYGAFEVTVQDPEHPIMQEVPTTFTIEDELYYFERDAEGAPMQVLATGEEPETGRTFPVVWTVERGDGRIVVNTLGHDGAAHEHPAFQQMLQNSARWAAQENE